MWHALASAARPRRLLVTVAVAALLLSGCVHGPQTRSRRAADGHRVAEIAMELRGKPYRFGGESPNGFDCSGLVHYAYERAGMQVPRTARAQYEAVRPLYRGQLEPGDVVFFRTRGVFVSHVGIYVGDDRFVHALNAGEPVKVSDLDTRYWSRRLVRAGSLAR